MKKNVQRILIIVLAAALILSILVPLVSSLAYAGITQDDIDDIKSDLADISAEKKKVQAQLNAIRGDLSKAKEQVRLIQSQITLTEHEISTSQRLLDEYDLKIQDAEEHIADLEEQEAAQYEEFYAQVRWLEETGSVSYISVFFEASTFSEMLDYVTLISDIMDYSDRIIGQLEATQQLLTEARTELQTSRDAQAQTKAELDASKAELEAQREEAERLYGDIAKKEAGIAAEARKLAADEAEINRQLKDAEKKYAEQLAALNNSGAWYWPLPGIYKLSSLFGARKDPFTGKASNHTGVDIPASSGTKIYSAQGGVVTTVGTNREHSYGYYCIVSHGNGKATLYAHMKSIPIVKEGQTIEKGQVIGYVGSTGRSTGPHLHFELRNNGTRYDALTLYPNLTFISPGGATIKGG